MKPVRPHLFDFIKRNGAWVGFLALAFFLTILTDGGFLAARNLTNLLRQTAINGVLAAGMAMVILTGGIDLSIGSLVALTGILAGIAQVHWEWSHTAVGTWGTFMLAVGAGAACGVVNGSLIAGLGIPPFVITLGTMVIARGLALILSDGSGISPMGESFRIFGEGYLDLTLTFLIGALLLFPLLAQLVHTRGKSRKASALDALLPLATFSIFLFAFVSYKGFPIPVAIMSLVLAFAALALKHTAWGRGIYAIGSNERAAYWSGVPVRKVKASVYVFMGTCAGIAGALLTARLNGAVPTAGNLFELDAIAAVVIGGTSLRGGVGTIMGTLVGALTIATLNNGMDLLQVPSFYQMVFKGAIIIGAVAMDRGQRQS